MKSLWDVTKLWTFKSSPGFMSVCNPPKFTSHTGSVSTLFSNAYDTIVGYTPPILPEGTHSFPYTSCLRKIHSYWLLPELLCGLRTGFLVDFWEMKACQISQQTQLTQCTHCWWQKLRVEPGSRNVEHGQGRGVFVSHLSGDLWSDILRASCFALVKKDK